jgi:hypothetical protein
VPSFISWIKERNEQTMGVWKSDNNNNNKADPAIVPSNEQTQTIQMVK